MLATIRRGCTEVGPSPRAAESPLTSALVPEAVAGAGKLVWQLEDASCKLKANQQARSFWETKRTELAALVQQGADGAALPPLNTTLARRILEAMSDAQFRTWANRLITTVAGYYILYGGWLLFTRTSAMATTSAAVTARIWVTPPAQGIQVPESEARTYEQAAQRGDWDVALTVTPHEPTGTLDSFHAALDRAGAGHAPRPHRREAGCRHRGRVGDGRRVRCGRGVLDTLGCRARGVRCRRRCMKIVSRRITRKVS